MRLAIFTGSSPGYDPRYAEAAANFAADLADGFVALPGGVGTLEEVFEAWTWLQLGIHAKPVAFLNIGGFWDHLLAGLDGMVDAGFVKEEFRSNLVVAGTAEELLAALDRWRAPDRKWRAAEVPGT